MIRAPSEFVGLTESRYIGSSDQWSGLDVFDWGDRKRVLPQFDPDAYLRHQQRHSGTFNVWFVDNHVEGIPMIKLFDDTDDARRRWNYDNEP